MGFGYQYPVYCEATSSLRRMRSTALLALWFRRALDPLGSSACPEKKKVLRVYRERVSFRGVERLFGVCRQTVMRWLMEEAQQLPKLRETLLPAQPGDVLELDEAWSFAGKSQEKCWLWTALCRRTRQIVAFVIGDHSEGTCRRLWQRIPAAYRRCLSFSDFWKAYQTVIPAETHQSVGKESGQTAHMEHWYNTLRQWLAWGSPQSASPSQPCYEFTTSEALRPEPDQSYGG
jgi:IS1 family transposase